jgi:hypothetical protein
MFCRDAGAGFDWCRVCGRGMPKPPESGPESSPLSEAIRKASGEYTGDEVVSMIEAYNRGAASVDGPDIPLDLAPGEHVIEANGRRIHITVSGHRGVA